MSADELDADKIAENAMKPQSASGDTGSVTQHSISDQIMADKYKRSKEAGSNGNFGLRFGRFVPPGANG